KSRTKNYERLLRRCRRGNKLTLAGAFYKTCRARESRQLPTMADVEDVAAFEDGSTRGNAMHAFGELAGAGLVKLKPAAAVWPLVICSRLLLHQTTARVRRDISAGIFRDGQPIPIQIDDCDDRCGA